MSKPLIICGSAACFFKDLRRAEVLLPLVERQGRAKTDVACANYTALYYPYFFEHWISYHIELLSAIKKYVKGTPVVHSTRPDPSVDRVWNFDDFTCTDSGLLSVKIALGLGYDRIVLVGMPIDNTPKFFSPNEPCQFDATNIRKAWEGESQAFTVRVRSFSGFTKRLLGEPSKEWLNGD